MIKQTHTFARLEVSQRTFDEIKQRLQEAEYQHAFHFDTEEKVNTIDMQGIALVEPKPVAPGTPVYVRIEEAIEHGAEWLEDRNKLAEENKAMRKVLQGVVDSTVHPDVAVRALLVDLKPIRDILTKKSA